MRFSRLIACGWPGLLSLWFGGQMGGLFHAFAFGIVLNLAVWAQWARPDWVSIWLRIPLWIGISFWWLACARGQWLSLFAGPGRGVQQQTVALFQRAQAEYLKGKWFEARALLDELLRLDEEDPEARLLLATLHRRRGDLTAASNELDLLAKCERALSWRTEITWERKLLQRQSQLQPAETNQHPREKEPDTNQHALQTESENARRTESENARRIESENNEADDENEIRHAA